ncbi:APC family permease [Ferruginibacter paludis]|uniref:APC family permease n=1 Tax=Ferruginibacter paludis TaxID=1310417 RepID=UPI0025B3DE55|nr:APC family permease [Ferruginibacter paludis]MDN3654011.1 APC family permease [Ferruginibacter paludis]
MKNKNEYAVRKKKASLGTDKEIAPVVKLRRVLSLSDLIIYGIILIQPVAALPLFGHANDISRGHAVTSILIAMVAMIFTAVSYGRMANRFPEAGSAYTYVGKSLHPYLGFVAGWSMFLDYLFIPIICVIFTSITANHLLPFIPYYFWILFFTAGFTLLNLNGIKLASKANWILMIIMSVVVFYFMAAAIRYIFIKNGIGGLFSSRPFYNPDSFSLGSLGPATALAALTYIGFDGLTTLSEEVKNPRRNVLLAAVITCLITGIWSGAQIYLAQVSWPDWASFTQGLSDEAARNNALDTAIMSVANRVGGTVLDASLSFILLLGSVGSGVTGQIGASRLLYGMGRDSVIPKKFFGHLDKKHSGPNYNVMIVGALALLGAILLNYEECARLINFGAFFAFMGVNISSIREYYFKPKEKSIKSFLLNFLPSFIGFLICLIIWLNLPLMTFIIGGSWMLIGILYLAIRTKGFRKRTIMIDFS